MKPLQQENKMLQQHIDKYSSSLNEKSKELERLGLLGEETNDCMIVKDSCATN